MQSATDIHAISKKCDDVAALLKVMAHPGRLRILCHLVQEEKSVQDIEALTGLSQSYTSQFLGKMRLEGLLSCRKEGVQVFYRISDDRVQNLMGALYDIFCQGEAS